MPRGLLVTADLIAVVGNPLDDIDAPRKVRFVRKYNLVFKRDGVMTPERFLHGGPVKGWQIGRDAFAPRQPCKRSSA